MLPLVLGGAMLGTAALSGIGGAAMQGESNYRARQARDALKGQATEVGKQYGEIEKQWAPATQNLGADFNRYQGVVGEYDQGSSQGTG